jgi:clan AA aspartic protease (TIGR02281 family)
MLKQTARTMSIQLPAAGLIALLAGFCYQQPSLAAQLSADDHRLSGWLDQDYGCYVDSTVDGVPFQMLVDTGSNELVFNRSHLQKLGISARRLIYNQLASTSNGLARSAPFVVHELHIGTLVLYDVPAVVDYAGMDEPLLGMSVIKYMNLQIGRDGCELRW